MVDQLEPILPKIITGLLKLSYSKMEREYQTARLLDEIGFLKLHKDFDSIFVNALVEYGVDSNNINIVELFSISEVRKALKEEFYDDYDDNFRREVKHNITVNPKFRSLKEESIEPEIEKFKGIFSKIINDSRDPKEIETHNKIKGLELTLLKQTFYYQAESYLKMLWKEFEREFGKDKYIDINAEMRSYNTWEKMIEFSKGMNKYYTAQNSNVTINLEKIEKWFTESKNELEDNKTSADLIVKNSQNNEIFLIEYKNTIFPTINSFDPVNDFISKWINDDSKKFLLILGEYGTGKSTLTKFITSQLAKSYTEGNSVNTKIFDKSNRLVFNFALKEFKAERIENFLVADLSSSGIKQFGISELYNLIDKKDLIMIFDGFDEMAQKIDTAEKERNFFKIKKLADGRDNCKIILTSREEYFESKGELKNVLDEIKENEIDIIHIKNFDELQIKKFLKSHSEEPDKLWETIKANTQLFDLSQRAVLLNMLVELLPKLIEEKIPIENINASLLYSSVINKELKRKANEVSFLNEKIKKENRLLLLERLSVWLYLNDRLTFDTKDLIKDLNLSDYFGTDDPYELRSFLNDFLSFSFLLREKDNVFKLSHRSFQEYLVSCAFLKEINDFEIVNFGKKKLTVEICNFIFEQKPDIKNLIKIAENSNDPNEQNLFQCTNAISILIKTNKDYLTGRDFSNSKIFDINFKNCALKKCNFENSHLTNCEFDTNIFDSPFNNANFRNSKLELLSNKINNVDVLRNLTNLSELRIESNQLIDISPIKNLTKLTSLWLYCKIDNLTPLEFLHSLTTLSLSDIKCSELKSLAKLKNISSLIVSITNSSKELGRSPNCDISPLAELKNLSSLSINGHIIDIEPLKDLINLTSLRLVGYKIPNYHHLENLTKLNSLTLSGRFIEDLSGIDKLKSLSSLSITAVNQVNLDVLENLNNLTDLFLMGSITDIRPLGKLHNLKSLMLSSNEFTNIKPLEKLSDLNSLALFNDKITDISSLNKLTNLSSLNLHCKLISQEQIEELKKELPNLKN